MQAINSSAQEVNTSDVSAPSNTDQPTDNQNAAGQVLESASVPSVTNSPSSLANQSLAQHTSLRNGPSAHQNIQHQQHINIDSSTAGQPEISANHVDMSGPILHHQVQQHNRSPGQHHRHGHSASYHQGQSLGPQHYQQPVQHLQHRNKQYNPRGDNESNLNHVLLITVIEPNYTITCGLIHQICSTYGKVNRIVIFRKNGVQAMVEFDSVNSAKRAKSMLHGCDIYSGCCTLRIEYAKPTKLNVRKNDNDSFDYTNPNMLSPGSSGNDVNGQNCNITEHLHLQQSQQTGNVLTGLEAANVQHLPLYSSSHMHSHNARSMPNRRAGLPLGAQGQHHAHQGFHQHQEAHHHQHVQQHNPQQQHHISHHSGKQQGSQHQNQAHNSPAYQMNQNLLDQTSSSAGGDQAAPFHHDAAFNIQRSAPSYIGSQQYMSTAHASGHGQVHGSPYQRHDPHAGHHHQHHQQQGQNLHHQHQQHHHHQSRSNLDQPTGHGMANQNHSTYPSGNSASNIIVPSQGAVMMVYGLHPERVNCDRLFNLFCLYGNVIRIKFLRSKEGCAMVQMGDIIAIDRCVSSLNKTLLFGNELQVSYSKQPFLHEVVQPFALPDGSPSFKDFIDNKNNRFKNPELASKNRILPPSHVLHFFNAPSGFGEDELLHLIKQTSGHEPVSLKIFTPKVENSKSFSGLMIFRDSNEASEALVLCNHLNIPKAGGPHPYILRLCFSPPNHELKAKPNEN